MLVRKLYTENTVRQAEMEFYNSYEWCLNPILTLKDLFRHLLEEFEKYNSFSLKWQREECKLNLYLFVCAIACTVDDFIAWKPLDLSSLISIYPKINFLIKFLQSIINLPYSIRYYVRINSLNKWETRWIVFVDKVCRLLLRSEEIEPNDINNLKIEFLKFRKTHFPAEVLNRRMKLIEGFRCQDLTHLDFITLANKFLETKPDKSKKFVVIGPRTAGAYLAPLVKVYLELNGFKKISWVTLRPKKGLSRLEKIKLSRLLSNKTNVILVDDYSNTGRSFRLLQNYVHKYGVQSKKITILAPLHPLKPHVNLSESKEVRILTLHHHELYKKKLSDSIVIENLMKDYLSDEEWDQITIGKNSFVDLLNSNFEKHYSDSFQVRQKKIWEIYLRNQIHQLKKERIFGKSVGWGWFGYHAYIAGIRLKDFVPETIGLRKGILFTKWIEGMHLDHQTISEKNLERISHYIAKRVQKLSTSEYPLFTKPNISWGWLETLSLLRKAYGVRFGYLKYKVLKNQLRKCVKTIPTLIDGRMHPGEWVAKENVIIKTDFEQHNFGAPELDIVDPAYDLAATSFEFQISAHEEEKLIATYSKESGDETINDRIFLFKLLYATIVKNKSQEKLIESNPTNNLAELNFRYLRSRNFLIYTMNNFCSGILKTQMIPVFKQNLFFLDLDGVFDSEVFGFAHTTLSGLAAVALLKVNSYSVILNTGRSIEHVRNYCSSYKFEGGIAEYGSVIWDNLKMCEVPLIDEKIYFQLAACREALRIIKGIFIDDDYKYSIRAYRFNQYATEGLRREEAMELLNFLHLDKLKIISRKEDTYFVGVETSKGNALQTFKNYVRHINGTVAAIGDSNEDISMLEIADKSFAPANCSSTISKLAKQKKCNKVSQYHQQGLFKAVNILLKNKVSPDLNQFLNAGKANTFHRLMFYLLWRAEQSKLEKVFTLFFNNRL